MVWIPRYISKPLMVLWLESDEVVVLCGCAGLAKMTGGVAVWVFTIALFLLYRSRKQVNGRGLLRHIPHIFGFKSFKGFPHAFVKEFSE